MELSQSASLEIPAFYVSQFSLLCLQHPTTGPYPEPDESNYTSHIISLRLYSRLCLGLPSGLFPSSVGSKILYTLIICPHVFYIPCPSPVIWNPFKPVYHYHLTTNAKLYNTCNRNSFIRWSVNQNGTRNVGLLLFLLWAECNLDCESCWLLPPWIYHPVYCTTYQPENHPLMCSSPSATELAQTSCKRKWHNGWNTWEAIRWSFWSRTVRRPKYL
jgi:hypothetical protein